MHDAAGHSGPARFIFDSENGGIDGWNPAVGATGPAPSTVTEVAVRNGANAVYKGLAIGQASDGHTYLYAANFRSGRVEAYDNTFTPVELPGGLFVDPRIPAGYAPFNVQELAGKLYVTYAKQDATLHDDVAGRGHGFVDVFTNDGAFVRRLVTRGLLNSPWGWRWPRPASAGSAARCWSATSATAASTPTTPRPAPTWASCATPTGKPIAIDGLWGLRFGNGNAAKTGELLFSAGTGRRVARAARQDRACGVTPMALGAPTDIRGGRHPTGLPGAGACRRRAALSVASGRRPLAQRGNAVGDLACWLRSPHSCPESTRIATRLVRR